MWKWGPGIAATKMPLSLLPACPWSDGMALPGAPTPPHPSLLLLSLQIHLSLVIRLCMPDSKVIRIKSPICIPKSPTQPIFYKSILLPTFFALHSDEFNRIFWFRGELSLLTLALEKLLLLSHFSLVWLCATPSLGFSRQEHWSGLPFPSPMHKSESESEVAQSCPTLHDPMDCSLPGSSVHGIFQARVLEWGAIAFSKELVLWKLDHPPPAKRCFNSLRPWEISKYSGALLLIQTMPDHPGCSQSSTPRPALSL